MKNGKRFSSVFAESEKNLGANGGKNRAPVEQAPGEGSAQETEISLSDEAVAELLYLIEEEKLAGDIYEAFYAQTGAKIFDRIAASEDRHMDALVKQAAAAGLDVSGLLALPEGTYQDDDLQALYDELLAMGSQSRDAALEVGVLIETTDIVDLQEASESVEGTQLADVYDALLKGSISHLDAFESLLG